MLKYTDNTLMPYGAHKGQKLANVPAGYLLWMFDNGKLSDPLKDYVKENMDALKAEAKRSARNNAR